MIADTGRPSCQAADSESAQAARAAHSSPDAEERPFFHQWQVPEGVAADCRAPHASANGAARTSLAGASAAGGGDWSRSQGAAAAAPAGAPAASKDASAAPGSLSQEESASSCVWVQDGGGESLSSPFASYSRQSSVRRGCSLQSALDSTTASSRSSGRSTPPLSTTRSSPGSSLSKLRPGLPTSAACSPVYTPLPGAPRCVCAEAACLQGDGRWLGAPQARGRWGAEPDRASPPIRNAWGLFALSAEVLDAPVPDGLPRVFAGLCPRRPRVCPPDEGPFPPSAPLADARRDNCTGTPLKGAARPARVSAEPADAPGEAAPDPETDAELVCRALLRTATWGRPSEWRRPSAARGAPGRPVVIPVPVVASVVSGVHTVQMVSVPAGSVPGGFAGGSERRCECPGFSGKTSWDGKHEVEILSSSSTSDSGETISDDEASEEEAKPSSGGGRREVDQLRKARESFEEIDRRRAARALQARLHLASADALRIRGQRLKRKRRRSSEEGLSEGAMPEFSDEEWSQHRASLLDCVISLPSFEQTLLQSGCYGTTYCVPNSVEDMLGPHAREVFGRLSEFRQQHQRGASRIECTWHSPNYFRGRDLVQHIKGHLERRLADGMSPFFEHEDVALSFPSSSKHPLSQLTTIKDRHFRHLEEPLPVGAARYPVAIWGGKEAVRVSRERMGGGGLVVAGQRACRREGARQSAQPFGEPDIDPALKKSPSAATIHQGTLMVLGVQTGEFLTDAEMREAIKEAQPAAVIEGLRTVDAVPWLVCPLYLEKQLESFLSPVLRNHDATQFAFASSRSSSGRGLAGSSLRLLAAPGDNEGEEAERDRAHKARATHPAQSVGTVPLYGLEFSSVRKFNCLSFLLHTGQKSSKDPTCRFAAWSKWPLMKETVMTHLVMLDGWPIYVVTNNPEVDILPGDELCLNMHRFRPYLPNTWYYTHDLNHRRRIFVEAQRENIVTPGYTCPLWNQKALLSGICLCVEDLQDDEGDDGRTRAASTPSARLGLCGVETSGGSPKGADKSAQKGMRPNGAKPQGSVHASGLAVGFTNRAADTLPAYGELIKRFVFPNILKRT
ncbi:hypothetical protein BESB_055500 [Besnoitia besnoiti]|uniref:Uncharacterized protein n=1 Tax=Besnoitia besnoiti TaxID=94643 RepID=A0A2A9MDE8_BESBE|nr:hypothetical protein BESB_055500 [Besnoitia besnoiti]PFH35899.1 hypothetical protein BESB_055500 [Besnoitia besnoiti]